jgi:hypothetical protein
MEVSRDEECDSVTENQDENENEVEIEVVEEDNTEWRQCTLSWVAKASLTAIKDVGIHLAVAVNKLTKDDPLIPQIKQVNLFKLKNLGEIEVVAIQILSGQSEDPIIKK